MVATIAANLILGVSVVPVCELDDASRIVLVARFVPLGSFLALIAAIAFRTVDSERWSLAMWILALA